MTVAATKIIHGGNIISMAKRLGCRIDELVDLSSNLTPFGMVPGLREAISGHLDEIGFLPETGSQTLRDLFAAGFDMQGEDQVLVGNGTTEFIFAVPAALHPGRAIIINPTYSDYHLACKWAGVPVSNFDLAAVTDFSIDLAKLGGVLYGGELVFICNPNNPTGALVPTGELHAFIKKHKSTLFLVDESYLPFVDEQSLLTRKSCDNLLVLSSFSKIYGIPGLRLGFLSAPGALLKKMSVQRKPWGVNRVAQIAGEFLIANGEEYADRVRKFVAEERPRVIGELKKISGIRTIDGVTNFILCHLDCKARADQLWRKMVEEKIMIRNCATFTGLDNRYFRMSLKEVDTNDKCLSVLKKAMQELEMD